MKLKQKKMAEMLGVPANTLSRWENGATTPDAVSLAAIYSLAKEHGMTAEFFQPRKSRSKTKKQRDRVSTMWDLNSMNFSPYQIREIDAWITDQIRTRFGNPHLEWFKVFAKPGQRASIEVLAELDWDVWEHTKDIENELVSHAKSDCGQKPNETIFVMIGRHNAYVELLDELTDWGVDVYVVEPSFGYGLGRIDKVAEHRRIRLPMNFTPVTTISTDFTLDRFLGR